MLRFLDVAGGQSESFAHRNVIPAQAGTSTDYNDIPALGKFSGGPRFRGDDRRRHAARRGDDSGYRAGWPGAAG
jgi:hypothetical protein